MRLLLDTHTFLWLNGSPNQLSQTAMDYLSSGEHQFYLSIASPWEIQIKTQLGKLTLDMPFELLFDKNCYDNNIMLLPIELSHIKQLEHLPLHHKDPFDRIMIAQAINEKMTILSIDEVFSNYGVNVVW